jgi:threonine dehydrogenase-like Zn-dependent dehydrogenase
MTTDPLPNEILACMLTGAGMGYYCEYTGPASSAKLDASACKPPKGASDEQLAQWDASHDRSLAGFIRIFAPEGAPPPGADPRDLISFLSHELIDIAPFAPLFRPQRIPIYEPGPGETLAKVQAICLCFSDCKVIHQGGGHVRLFNRDLAKEPNVPGHEACLEVVALGEGTEETHGVHVGDRFSIQADIYVEGVSHAFGYFHRGAMQQYTCLAEEVLDNDRGNCLIPIDARRLAEHGPFAKEGLGRAEVALSEPWGCVAARIEYRKGIEPGGTAWVIGATMADLDEVAAIAERAGQLILSGGDAPQLAPKVDGEILPCVNCVRQAVGEAGIDDILMLQGDAQTVEAAADLLAPHGVMVLPPFDEGSDAQLDIGAIHYRGRYFLAHTEPTIAATNAKPRRTKLKGGGRALFVGAGGPMGQIYLQTAIDSPQPPSWMLVTEIDDTRLAHLEALFGPQAQAKGIEMRFANPLKTDLASLVEPQSLDDVVGLCPVWMPVKAAEPFVAPDGLINVFAGIKVGTKGPVDLGVLARGVTIIGNSGSSVEDLQGVLVGALRGELRPNTSVAVIGPLAEAWEAMRQVMYRETSGKICLFPELDLPGLIPLADLARHFPTVAERLDDHGFWTCEAEEELFRVCPRVET